MAERVIVLDRGNVEFLCPQEWTVAPGKEGYVTLSDPDESCRLEASYTKLPAEAADVDLELLLKQLLTRVPESGSPSIETSKDGNRRLAWADYSYPSTNKRTGDAADAHGRWLLGTNGLFQLLMTFYYWADDAAWAVPAWTRIVSTIQFGDGSQLERPEEHWSMRRKN